MQKIKNWKTQTKIYFIIVEMVVLLNIMVNSKFNFRFAKVTSS